jgi:hypothetical protein
MYMYTLQLQSISSNHASARAEIMIKRVAIAPQLEPRNLHTKVEVCVPMAIATCTYLTAPSTKLTSTADESPAASGCMCHTIQKSAARRHRQPRAPASAAHAGEMHMRRKHRRLPHWPLRKLWMLYFQWTRVNRHPRPFLGRAVSAMTQHKWVVCATTSRMPVDVPLVPATVTMGRNRCKFPT